MTKSDRELRDKLASEYALTRIHSEAFKDGWDAARANPESRYFIDLVCELEKGRDQLRAQIEALKTENSNLQNNYTEAKSTAKHVIDQLRAQIAQQTQNIEDVVKENEQLRAEVERLIGVVDIKVERKAIYMADAQRYAETAVTAFEAVSKLKADLDAEKNYSAETAARLELALKEYAEYVRGKPGEWYVTQLQAENDHLKAQCEKLAEAVEQQQKKGHNDTCSQILIGEGPCDCGKTLGGFALAEYRKMKKD